MDVTHPGAQPDAASSPSGNGSAAELRPIARRASADAPMLAIFGLLVVWASLVIVFTANRLSESYYHLDATGLTGLSRNSAVLMSLDPQVKILLPFTIFVPRMTPAEALQTVGSYVNFHVLPEGLDKLDTKRQNFRYVDQPVYAVLHKLIQKPTLGLLLQNNNLSLIDQKLEIKQGNGSREMLWEAELALPNQRTLIVPSGELPIWLSLRLIGEATEDINHWNSIQVEVHRAAELLTMTRAVLDEKGNAVMSMSDVQTISLRIQRLAAAQGKESGRYRINFHYQAAE